ncbi:uncharacterized protein LOC111106567 [Crassostrea virginica]
MTASKTYEEVHNIPVHVRGKNALVYCGTFVYKEQKEEVSRGTPTEKTPIQAFKKSPVEEIPEYPISNEYWKNCAHAMNADLGSNRTGASCKSFYRRFLVSDTLHTDTCLSEAENEILAKPLEQETN